MVRVLGSREVETRKAGRGLGLSPVLSVLAEMKREMTKHPTVRRRIPLFGGCGEQVILGVLRLRAMCNRFLREVGGKRCGVIA